MQRLAGISFSIYEALRGRVSIFRSASVMDRMAGEDVGRAFEEYRTWVTAGLRGGHKVPVLVSIDATPAPSKPARPVSPHRISI